MMAIPTTNELSEEQQDAALRRIQENISRPLWSPLRDYNENFRCSISFRPGFNWDGLLSATPTAVMLLSALSLSLAVQDANEIQIVSPSTGFTHLKYVITKGCAADDRDF